MGTTTFSGPVRSGTLKAGETNGPNLGLARLEQFSTLNYNATLTSTSTLYIPAGSRIVSFLIDVLTAFNSATSATLTIGSTAGGSQYVSGVDVKAATGRIAITYTAAQLAAMAGLTVTGGAAATTAPIYITITSVGQPTAGCVTVSMSYVQQ